MDIKVLIRKENRLVEVHVKDICPKVVLQVWEKDS